DLFRITDGVQAARDRAGDRTRLDPVPFDPDVHLRRRADEVLAIGVRSAPAWGTEVDQEAVRGWVALAQATEDLRGRRRTRLEERPARDDLEQVSAMERFARDLDDRRVL